MKTITGKVLSTNPIALSKAASILSNFVSADTGASQAVCAYLRRASVSFNELAQLHKELKSNRKQKTSKSEIIVEEEKLSHSVSHGFIDGVQSVSHGVIDGVGSQMKKHNKKNNENGSQIVENKVGIKSEEKQGQVIEQSYKKKHTKMGEIGILQEDKVEMEIEEDGNLGMENKRKKHNKKNGIVIVEEKTTEKKKKRKSGEIEEGRGMHSLESATKMGEIGILEEDKVKMKIEEDGNLGMENERKKHNKKNGIVIVEEKTTEKKKKRKSGEIEEGRGMHSLESATKKKKKKN